MDDSCGTRGSVSHYTSRRGVLHPFRQNPIHPEIAHKMKGTGIACSHERPLKLLCLFALVPVDDIQSTTYDDHIGKGYVKGFQFIVFLITVHLIV